MNCQEMIDLLREPERLNVATKRELEGALKEYPYLLLARILYVLNLRLLRDINYKTELHTLSLLSSNRSHLVSYFEPVTSIYDEAAGVEEVGMNAFDLIDNFIAANVPNGGEALNIVAESNYFSLPQSENASDVTSTASAKPTAEDLLIDDFLSKKEERPSLPYPPDEVRPVSDVESIEDAISDDTYFTETLAKIYIRQKKYDKALEIIKRINLKYPKKSAYFADQIRFLEKLIINVKRDT